MALASRLPAARTLRKVSSRPLAFVMDNFVDAPTLATFQRGRRPTAQMDGKAAMQQMLRDLDPSTAASPLHHAFMSLVSTELFDGQWGDNDAVRVNASSSSDAHNDGSARVSYPDGLHVDTNNNATFRSATCILYLNDIAPESGGATIFPLAGAAEADPALSASRALLGEHCMHTRQAAAPLPSVGGVLSVSPLEGSVASPRAVADAALIEGRVDESVLRIQPRAGSLMIFFSRTDDGEVDPWSWHGGENIRPPQHDAQHEPAHENALATASPAHANALANADPAVTEKHIMTLFKEVHYKGEMLRWPYGCGGQSLASYLAPQIAQQRRHLESLAEAAEAAEAAAEGEEGRSSTPRKEHIGM